MSRRKKGFSVYGKKDSNLILNEINSRLSSINQQLNSSNNQFRSFSSNNIAGLDSSFSSNKPGFVNLFNNSINRGIRCNELIVRRFKK